MQNYGGRIKEARLKVGLTQAEAADKMGVSQQTWQRFETGKFDLKMSTVKSICDILNVSPNYVIGVEEKTARRRLSPKSARQVKNARRGGLKVRIK